MTSQRPTFAVAFAGRLCGEPTSAANLLLTAARDGIGSVLRTSEPNAITFRVETMDCN